MSTVPTTQSAVDGLALGLGTLVINQLYASQIEPDAMRSILAAEGDDASIVPDIDQAKAVRDAARAWRKGSGKATRFKTENIKPAETATTMKVGILQRAVDTVEAGWNQVDAVVFDKNAGAWVDSGNSVEAAEFITVADKKRKFLDHNFIRPELVNARMKAWGAFLLRKQGGIYYIPRQHDDDLERLARIIGQIGDCRLDLVTVSDTAKSRQAIGGRATAVLGDSLKEIRDRIDTWTERARNVKGDAVANALTELEDMRGHAALYNAALDIGVDELTASIDEAVQQAHALIAGHAESPWHKPSLKIRDLTIATREQYGDTVTLEQLKEAGWPASSLKRTGYWTGNAKRTLMILGLTAKLDTKNGVLEFSQLPGGPAGSWPEPKTKKADAPKADEPATPEGEVDITVAVDAIAKDKSVSVADLYSRYLAATGTKARTLRRGFKKVDLILEVVAAERIKQAA